MSIPERWHTVTPRIFAEDARGLVAFLQEVFEAAGDYQDQRPSEIWIGDSVILVGDTAIRKSTSASFYVYVSDVDATYRRALDTGAPAIEEPFDTPYGDRRGMVEDPWGNSWQIAMPQRETV